MSWAGPTVADDGESSDDDESVTENGDVSSIHNAAERVSVNDEPDSDLVNFDDADGDDEVEADREENFSIDIDPVESTPAVMQLIEPVHSETLLADWMVLRLSAITSTKTSGRAIKDVIAKLRHCTIFMHVL